VKALVITIMAAAALALSGCAQTTATIPAIPATPAEAANQTALDENGAIGAELAYKAARLAAETAVDAGILKGEQAARIKALDSAAYGAVQRVRAAYAAANASSYAEALSEAQRAISGLLALAGENR
jgi:ribosomal protein S20